MIKNFVQISLKEQDKGTIQEKINKNSLLLSYPCQSTTYCTPYVLKLSPGVYKFECWGSQGGQWSGESKPGLGAYTTGTLFIPRPTEFFVYIGNQGFFNALKAESQEQTFPSPGGATDVRLNASNNWWDISSLASRIMVAAGGGGAEWNASIGGNGGDLLGGESFSAISRDSNEVQDEPCPGATQTSGSQCDTIYYADGQYPAVAGHFGYSVLPDPLNNSGVADYGGLGGGGYYGGTSYKYSFAGSGGSSFISGHKGCDAVKDQSEIINHTGDCFHYSGYTFTQTKMIPGNETMPLPESLSSQNIHYGSGAFRITILLYNFKCTFKRSLYYSLIPNLFILTCLSI